MNTRNTFGKAERVVSRDEISALISAPDGYVSSFPLSIHYKFIGVSATPVKVLLVVPKRKLKKASERNRVKRLLREVYRNNKHLLFEKAQQSGRSLNLALFYKGETTPALAELSQKTTTLLEKLTSKLYG